jgi:hypothetical protein
MKLTRATGIIPLFGIVFMTACTDAPTVANTADNARPGYENGGSYGSGGKAQTDSAAPAGADATVQGDGNGGSYGSGG